MIIICSDCRHARRHKVDCENWNIQCSLLQSVFPDAKDCAFYQPPGYPDMGRESSGLGYAWDGEYEGRP